VDDHGFSEMVAPTGLVLVADVVEQCVLFHLVRLEAVDHIHATFHVAVSHLPDATPVVSDAGISTTVSTIHSA
jgi:hypothetical protein